MSNVLLDPTGTRQVHDTESLLAARPADLRGLTVGLLANSKQNADLFVEEVGRRLEERHGVGRVVSRSKTGSISMPVSPEQLDELAQACDVVVTGVGDCGSCSAAAVADGLLFEERGIPAAVICSDAFISTANAMAELKGAPDYRYLTTAHPIAALTPEQVAERADAILEGVIERLTETGRVA